MMFRFAISAAAACLLVLMSGGLFAQASYQKCNIEYHISAKAQPGKHTSSSPDRKEFTACVRNLADCTRRAKALAQARESVFVPAGEGDVPDLSTLRVSGHSIDGHCSELD